MDKPGQCVKDLRVFVMNICIIELVSLSIGLDWKDDLIKGAPALYGRRTAVNIPDIVNCHGYWGTFVRISRQMVMATFKFVFANFAHILTLLFPRATERWGRTGVTNQPKLFVIYQRGECEWSSMTYVDKDATIFWISDN